MTEVIKAISHCAETNNLRISCFWISGCVGTVGNEKADATAINEHNSMLERATVYHTPHQHEKENQRPARRDVVVQ